MNKFGMNHLANKMQSQRKLHIILDFASWRFVAPQGQRK